MKRRIFILLIISLCCNLSYSQQWKWSRQMKCSGNVTPIDVITDNSGNIYVTGTYNSGILYIGSDTLQNKGGDDAFIAKFNNNGVLQWMKRIGGNLDDETTSLVIIGSNLWVGGSYKSTPVYFSPTVSLANVNNFDSFIAQYDLNGNLITAVRIFSGTDVQRIKDILYNSTNNRLLILAQYKNQIRYTGASGAVTLTAKSTKDLIVAVSDLSGVIQDTAIYATNPQNSILKDINHSNDGGFYLSGDLFGTVNFGGGNTITGHSTTTADMMILKIDQNLDFQWVRHGGALGYDHANNAVADIYGNIYVTGKVESNATFDSTATLQSQVFTDFGAQDLYLAKYNKLGNLQWVKRKGNAGNDDGSGLIQRENLVQFCGNISGQVIFNVDTLKSSGTTDVNTGFAIFNTTGDEIGAQGIGGTGTDRGNAITFDPSGNTIITGLFASTTMSIGDSTYTNSSGFSNGFIASFTYPMNAVFTSVKQLNCNGASDGQLIVTPYFGVAPYTYTWSANALNKNDSLAYNLPAGTYSVTVTDSRAISANTSITLTQPSKINILSAQTNVSCFPSDGVSNNGTINLTISGGTSSGSYTYNWVALSGSGVNATSEDQNSLTKGTYITHVYDDNLCEASDTFTISEPLKIQYGQSIITNETIPPGGNGAINLTVTGGNPVYTYSWSKAGVGISNNEDLTNINGGAYKIQITDSKSCLSDTTFLIQNDTMLIAYISSKTDVNCKGQNTGSATVGLLNGTGPYTFVWKNTLGNTVDGNNASVSNLIADSYYITVTDNSNGKTASTSVKIDEPTLPLSINLIIGNDLKCYSDTNGVADLTANGGTLPYSFHWSNNATTEDLIDLRAGDYSVTVTDNNGCVSTDNITLDAKPALDLNITVFKDISCYGELSGALDAIATGGTGTKQYLWDDPGNQNAQRATTLGAGTYHVTATDQSGCSITGSYILDEPADLVLSETHFNVSCTGNPDGNINLSVAGGTVTYNYEWSNGQLSQDLSGLTSGTYKVTVTDAHNCIDSLAIDITQSPPITIQSLNITDASCYGYGDGKIDVGVSGGSGIYQYSSNGGTNFYNDSSIIDLSAGDYSVIVRDNTGCISSDSSVSISQPDKILFQTISLITPSCYGYTNGSISITAGGGAGAPYQYSINNGSTFSTIASFSNLTSQSYNLLLSDADGCLSSDSLINLTQPDSITFSSENATNISCNGLTDGYITIIVNGTASDFNYSVDNGQNYLSNNGVFTGLSSGLYQVRVRDNNNCEQSGSLLTITEPAVLLVDTTSITHVLGEQNGALEATSSGGTSPITFILDQTNADSSINNTGKFSGIAAGNYILYAIDNNACLSDSLNITILQESTAISLYDGFSPNDDGVNDTWNIININLYPKCKVSIFNSWGNLVFSSDGYTEPWDGKYNGKLLPAGTYYYIIDLGDGSGQKAGPVSIIR